MYGSPCSTCAQESRAWYTLMKLMSLSYCLLVAKPWLWKVLRGGEDQQNKAFSATRPGNVNHRFMRALIGVSSITGCDNISASFPTQWRVRPSHGEFGKERSVTEETFKFKIRKHPCVNCTERSVIVWMCWAMRSAIRGDSQAGE